MNCAAAGIATFDPGGSVLDLERNR
jgi:hypothetical protein